ncbi:phosphatidate phosphatase LPIN1 isoform X2 [Bacillus rossius redtenbacheri]|uniref:phosphatidate phosphatase LPIN1 isoform X2 n=1 Tax=Bacillus rossius redtenbacheri TaxID=93214 RepID=UPI002FDED938
MYSIGKLISNVKEFYNDINSATLTGAIDVVVVEQSDGNLACSPFHVRFGKLGVLRSREKVVDIEVNGNTIPLQMKLDDAGVAFFVEEIEESSVPSDPYMMCSPIPPDQPRKMLDECFPEVPVNEVEEVNFPLLSESKNITLRSTIASEISFKMYDNVVPTEESIESSIGSVIKEVRFVDTPKESEHTCKADDSSKVIEDSVQDNDSSLANMLPGDSFTLFPSPQDSNDVSPDATKCFSTPLTGHLIAALKMKIEQEEISDITDTTLVETHNESTDTSSSCSLPVKKPEKLLMLSGLTSNSESIEPNTKYDDEISHQSSESSCTYDSTPSEDEREKSKVTSRDEDTIAQTKDVSKSSTVGMKRKRRKKFNSKKTAQKKNLAEIEVSTAVSHVVEELKDGAITCSFRSATATTKIDDFTTTGSYHTAKSFERDFKSASVTQELSIASAKKLQHSEPVIVEADEDGFSAELSNMQHSQMDENYAFFSDTELAEGSNDDDHFPSDTECVLKHKDDAEGQDEEQEQSWRWGELPTPPPQVASIPSKDTSSLCEETGVKNDEKDNKQAYVAKQPGRLLFNMFNFMNMTKKIRRNPESEGIYLEDLDSGDITPEVAALYFPTYRRSQLNQPTESSRVGGGYGGGGGDADILSGDSEPSHISLEENITTEYSEFALSLCGKQIFTTANKKETFEKEKVTYDMFVNDLEIIGNPNLIVCCAGQYMTWGSALPQILSVTIFKKCLPKDLVEKLHDKYEQGVVEAASDEHPLEDSQLSSGTSYKSWLPWRRSPETRDTKLTDGDLVHKTEESASASCMIDEKNLSSVRPKSLPELTSVLQAKKQPIPIIKKDLSDGNSDRIASTGANDGSSGSGSSDDSELVGKPYPRQAFDTSTSRFRLKDKLHRKTLRLTSEQLVSLNLRPGLNKVVFSVTTAYQGTTRCMCHVYKWRYSDKIVISDIDGTITRSDVLGHVLPMLGKDWAQSGVAELFTKISNNGYKLLYLSARAIGQSDVTREYLKSVKQNNLSLPEGPVLLSPTSLLNAFHREVIEKKPEHFKIPCLKDLGKLFPSNKEPLYAGFGNRDSDCFTYSMVGIPEDRIFTINSRGEVRHGLMQVLISSYANLTDIVDQLFPPRAERQEADRYTYFTHWRPPVQYMNEYE